MNKIISLIKACMSSDMSVFRLRNKKQTKARKILLPIFFAALFMGVMGSYAKMILEPLIESGLEIVMLTIFVCFTSLITLIEGIYKSSSLLFNCKDDNLLLSLPIKKSTVLFIRVFKFYTFELIYNSLFILPAMVIYAIYVKISLTFCIASLIAILMLPIIPIVISCMIGGIISASSSKFKMKNIAQTIITVGFLLVIMYFSYNLDGLLKQIAENATSINEIITKIYYPAGVYANLITDFKIMDLIMFILINVILMFGTIGILSNIYFKVNSNVKSIKSNSKNKRKYKIKRRSIIKSLMKKELNRFINSPVFVTNAGFGLVLFVAASIILSIKFNSIIESIIIQEPSITIEQVNAGIPVIIFGLICLASLMSSITSSMISLEGRSFNILKSLPVKPFTIIFAKVITAVCIMLPFILIGDLILFIRFKLTIYEIIIIIISSLIIPIVAETIGIIVNLKYPRMDAENDTQVVKQSMSSAISVFIGIILIGITGYSMFKLLDYNINPDLIITGILGIYMVLLILMYIYIKKIGVKQFKNIYNIT